MLMNSSKRSTEKRIDLMENNKSDYLTIEEAIKEYEQTFSSKKLPPNLAKLYSHYTKLSIQQAGLKSWTDGDFNEQLNEAVRLISIGFYQKENYKIDWEIFFQKAGEILEWISYPEINTCNYPLHLLAASCYQIAGYPALATGLLNERISDSDESEILRLLIKNDFSQMFVKLQNYWQANQLKDLQSDLHYFREDIDNYIVREVISIIGILYAFGRWGDKDRLNLASEKFLNISKFLLHDKNSLNWLFSKLCTEMFNEMIEKSLRIKIDKLLEENNRPLNDAFESYMRQNFKENKLILWPSQIKGVKKLVDEGSFVLCTPTGSGKTTIAELAIIKNIFNSLKLSKEHDLDIINILSPSEPIVLYLVPSRALATEVEWKLNKVLQNIGSKKVKVTGLYGGIDWGPTDAWINTDEKTVLVCTYEKGEALLRFLGPLFLYRVSLIIIDEAHFVQFDHQLESLVAGDNRSLRLESLANRLVSFSHQYNRNIIALSAVIGDKAQYLSDWITKKESKAEQTPYRSTRQLIGKLEYYKSGNFEIRYDLLNGSVLRFNENDNSEAGKNQVPFVPNPFPASPLKLTDLPKRYIGETKKFSKNSRPFLFWASLQLAKEKEHEAQSTILISITQNIHGYAQDFLHVIEKVYKNKGLPSFFKEPESGHRKNLWEKCLNSCEDYYGRDSVEYKLLKKGIVVHYGRMPGLMSRLLIQLINQKIVHIVLATSTLSEGINLPFDIIIIPLLVRRGENISASEFANLVGRAGRPGNGTEGRSLVFLEAASASLDYSAREARKSYIDVIKSYLFINEEELNDEDKNSSPLANLLSYIRDQWQLISNSNSDMEFMNWLENCVPITNEKIFENAPDAEADKALDTLDSIILSSIVEFEQLKDTEMTINELENFLKTVWGKTYAYHSTNFENRLEKIYLQRGESLLRKIYPNKDERRRLYRTSLQPRFAYQLFEQYDDILNQLKKGFDYKDWVIDEKINYIADCIKELNKLNKFKVKDETGTGSSTSSWEEILSWWLSHGETSVKPSTKQISNWIKFIYDNFNYKFNWGLGTVLSLIMDEVNNGVLVSSSLDSWHETELPWIVFWMKELMTWGTYDPIVAYLLSNGFTTTRVEALEIAKKYYKENPASEKDEDIYDARIIKKWVEKEFSNTTIESNLTVNTSVPVKLTKDFSNTLMKKWRVFPLKKDNQIQWIDPAGYLMAQSSLDEDMVSLFSNDYEFTLNVELSEVNINNYFI
jgi:flagellar biosynthesis GTPase FlhF